MKKNIVLIRTVESMGTGILYPCHYEKTKDHCRSYIVFTNRHVLNNMGVNVKNENMKDLIILQIYDDNGKLVETSNIKQVLVHNPLHNNNKQEDVAALLVDIDECVPITLQTRIYQGELEDRSTLYMEGYPGVMLDDEISQKVQLQGMSKAIFPHNEHIGVYQISDDYHWYNNYQDLKLMEGFSGSPVYRYEDKKAFIVGMNQSIADIDSGENPFKLVYYLKMKHVLECLRKTGCILFRRLKDNEYQIEWIYGLEVEIEKYENHPTLLLLGGSGAGKSSFAKDFALNGDKLCSTNDGQTTRTNVIYEYSILRRQSEATARLMTQDEFQERMERFYGIMPMLNFYQQLFKLSESPSKQDPVKYLRNMYYMIKHFSGKSNNAKWLVNMENAVLLNETLATESLWDIYERAKDVLLKWMPLDQIKYVCDREKINKIYKKYKENTAYNNYTNRTVPNNREYLKSLIMSEWDNGIDSNLLTILCRHLASDSLNFQSYQTACCILFTTDYSADGETLNNERTEINKSQILTYWKDPNFKRKVLDCVLNIPGFFSIDEFYFLDEQNIRSDIKAMLNRLTLDKEDSGDEDSAKSIREAAEVLCGDIYTLIKQKLSEHFHGIQNNRFEIKFQLNHLSKTDEDWLALCLQKKDDKSLTGILKYVKIKDCVSDEYALLLKELRISQLKILDTYGLDHVEWGSDAKNVLHDIRYRYEDEKEIDVKDMGILYLKKLDSGRPDELPKVLPCIYEVIPQAPVYCIFTGIDIFYANQLGQIENIQWKKEHAASCPKAVQYILSERGEEEIIKNINCRAERKKNYYLVLKNHLAPYCGRKELTQAEYVYYYNNLKYIRKVLSSIIMKEYSSLEIVPLEDVQEELENAHTKELLISLLEKLFEKASVRFWGHYHHMTVKANYKRIATETKENFVLGYWGVNRQRWDQLFHEAYRSVISQESAQFIQQFKNGEDAIEAAMLNMEYEFLGYTKDLYEGDLNNKNEFRRILEEMYECNEAVYSYNPFKNRLDPDELSYQEKKKYLEDVLDFAKGFRHNEEIREKFLKLFKEKFLAQLDDENKTKAKNLVKLDIDFYNSLHRLKRDFTVMYDNNHKALAKFHQILKYYFDITKDV